MNADAARTGTDDTRNRLLQASLDVFANADFDAVSVRRIVQVADANIAAVSYHFGGKQGLYLATAEFLAERLHARLSPLLDDIHRQLADEAGVSAETLLEQLIAGLVRNLLDNDLGSSPSGFIMREQMHPTAAFDVLFDRLMQPVQQTLQTLAVRIVGDLGDTRTQIVTTHALMGQILAFRVARTTVLRRLRQKRLSRRDIDLITRQITRLSLGALGSMHGENHDD